ncbi:MAG: glycosyltransferase family 4 protein, partial [Alphaproteobacteria bacterium]|nr:glycosyltransferase family 4 protein [Alphaproteobacteria bacterium]
KAHPFPMYAGLEQAAKKTKKKLHVIQAGWFANQGISDSFTQGAKDVCPSVNAIFLDGRKADVRREIWFAADIFCSLSDNIQETFGITPIEAMATGLPQVVTDWDGYKDTVRDGVDGFRVPTLASPVGAGRDLAFRYDVNVDTYDHYCAGACQSVSVDIAATAKAFLELIENPSLRKKMGEAGRERARSVYDWRVVIGQYEALWAELAAIRAKEAPQWEIRGLQEAEHPLYDDPFSLFASYPTRVLKPDDVITLLPGSTPERALELRRMHLNNFGYLATPDVFTKVIERIAEHGGSAAVRDIAPWITPSQRVTMVRTLVWFAKVGLVSISEHNRES